MSIRVEDDKGRKYWARPNYIHTQKTWEEATAALVEDIRNILEQVSQSQMLACEVRDDIRRSRIALEKLAKSKRKKKPR